MKRHMAFGSACQQLQQLVHVRVQVFSKIFPSFPPCYIIVVENASVSSCLLLLHDPLHCSLLPVEVSTLDIRLGMLDTQFCLSLPKPHCES